MPTGNQYLSAANACPLINVAGHERADTSVLNHMALMFVVAKLFT